MELNYHKLLDVLKSMVFNSKDPIIIEPYRGYASDQHIYLRGRVLEDEGWVNHNRRNFLRNFRDQFKRFESDEIPNVSVEVTFQDQVLHTTTDEEGYFLVEEKVLLPIHEKESWHPIHLSLKNTQEESQTIESWGELLLPNRQADIGIITDVDDTLIKTDVWSRWRTLKNSLFINPVHRLAIKGMSGWICALRDGNGEAKRPVFYVSNSPRNMYQYLLRFLESKAFPKGPVLLQDIGFRSPHSPHHKEAEIERILLSYPHLSFILLGDIAGDDPKIYLKFKRKYPERIKAIFLRDILHKGRQKAFHEWLEIAGKNDFIMIENGLLGATHTMERDWIKQVDYTKIKKIFKQ